jgi:hypothetical protein
VKSALHLWRRWPWRLKSVTTDLMRSSYRFGVIRRGAVREVIHGRPVRNAEALLNPEALELFKDRPELAR